MAELVREHRRNLGDAAHLVAELLRDIADLQLTPPDVDELSYYFDDDLRASVDVHVEDMWDLRVLELAKRRAP